MGMVMIIEGLPYFAFPSKMKEWVLMMTKIEDASLRKFGLVFMAAGLFIVYLAMKGA
jgi:uncharacterized protein YjeT (DUF2065 family)